MPELDDVIAQALEERTRSLADVHPSARVAASVSAHVRGRRVRRRALQVTAALPVVAALVAGGWALADREAAPVPPATQAPTPTGTATSEPAPSPTETGATPTALALPDEYGLPARDAAPADLLATTGPGWVLASYTPVQGEAPPTETVLVLASPGGKDYELGRLDPRADVPSGATWVSTSVLDWEGGARTAIVRQVAERWSVDYATWWGTTSSLAVLDLMDGTLAPIPLPDGDWNLAATWDGGSVWFDGSRIAVLRDSGVEVHELVQGSQSLTASIAVSPDGRLLLAGTSVLDLDTLDVVGTLGAVAGADCAPLGWWTADSLLLQCVDAGYGDVGVWPEAHPRLAVGALSGLEAGQVTVVREFGAQDVIPNGGSVWLADRKVALSGAVGQQSGTSPQCGDAGYLVQGPSATFTALTGPDLGSAEVSIQAARGFLALGTTHTGCTDWVGPTAVSLVDVTTGSASTVLPLPYGVAGTDLVAVAMPSGFALAR